MTPADAQRIANEFDEIYAAVLRNSGGTLDRANGSRVRVPLGRAVVDYATTGWQMLEVQVESIGMANEGLHRLAKAVLAHFADRGEALWFRLRVENELTAVPEPHLFPCRVTINGENRNQFRIEVGVRA